MLQKQHENLTFVVSLQDMLCFSGGGMLNIKASNFPVHQQKVPVSACFILIWFHFIAIFFLIASFVLVVVQIFWQQREEP